MGCEGKLKMNSGTVLNLFLARRQHNAQTMKSVEPKYLDVLETLVSELSATLPPPIASRIYASIRAVAEDLQCDLRDNTEISAHLKLYPEGQLKGVLLHCREATFLKTGADRTKALDSARECIEKIRSQLS